MSVPTDWSGLPLSTPHDTLDFLSKWENIYQFYRAIQYRELCKCNRYWPPGGKVWYDGVITGLTNTTLTDSLAVWETTEAGGGTQDRWNGWCQPWPGHGSDCDPTVPSTYDVIIGSDLYVEPWRIKRARIDTNGVSVVRFGDIGLTSGELTGLIGQRYAIIRQGAQFWHQRVPLANPPILWKGTGALVDNGGGSYTITDPTTTRPWRPVWTTDQFVGKKVVISSSVQGGYARFGTVTANDRTSFTFSVPSPFVPTSGDYVILRGDPGYYMFVGNSDAHVWHGMNGNGYWTKGTDGNTIFPVATFGTPATRTDSGNLDCTDSETKPVFDIDYYQSWDDECTEFASLGRDTFLHLNFYKAWRGIQAYLETAGGDWIPPGEDYDGKKSFYSLAPAYMFYKAGINALVRTTSTSSGDPDNMIVGTITTGVPEPIQVYYAIKKDDAWVSTGVFWCDDGQDRFPFPGADGTSTTSTTHCGTTTSTTVHPWAGLTCYLSFGFTRRVQRHFRFLYDRTYLEPDTDDDGGPLSPAAATPGTWVTRGPSTTYAKSDDYYLSTYNAATDGNYASSTMGQTIDSSEAFVSTEKARYLGDNFQDPSTGLAWDSTPEGYAEYIVKGSFEGQAPARAKGNLEAWSGIATAAGDGWIKDDNQTWLMWGEWAGYTSTATGGSSTTITDSTVTPVTYDVVTGDLTHGDARWDASTGRWIGFIVEITEGPCKDRKAPITAYNDSTKTITFAIPNFGWQYDAYKFLASNVEVGDVFTIGLSGDVVATVSFTATSSSPGGVAAGLQARFASLGVEGVTASAEGSYLVLIITGGYDIEFDPTTTNVGGGANTQDLVMTTETRAVTFKIHEPQFMLNRWRGRKVRVKGSGGPYVTTIDYSDGNTIWFSGLGYTPLPGDKYEIIEAVPGAVYVRDAGTGDESVNGWTPVTNRFKEKPTIKTRYGRAMKYDYPTPTLLNEIYACINLYRWQVTGGAWSDPTIPNSKTGSWFNDGSGLASMKTRAVAGNPPGSGAPIYYNRTQTAHENIGPYALSQVVTIWGWNGSVWSYSGPNTVGLQRHEDYLTVSPCDILNCSAEFYAHGKNETAVGDAGGFVFDDNGDSVTEGVYTLWSTVGGTGGRNSAMLGGLGVPNWATEGAPDCPGPAGVSTGTEVTNVQGYHVDDARVILKWDVSGGLSFVD